VKRKSANLTSFSFISLMTSVGDISLSGKGWSRQS
jgi:hypothetical protein